MVSQLDHVRVARADRVRVARAQPQKSRQRKRDGTSDLLRLNSALRNPEAKTGLPYCLVRYANPTGCAVRSLSPFAAVRSPKAGTGLPDCLVAASLPSYSACESPRPAPGPFPYPHCLIPFRTRNGLAVIPAKRFELETFRVRSRPGGPGRAAAGGKGRMRLRAGSRARRPPGPGSPSRR